MVRFLRFVWGALWFLPCMVLLVVFSFSVLMCFGGEVAAKVTAAIDEAIG